MLSVWWLIWYSQQQLKVYQNLPKIGKVGCNQKNVFPQRFSKTMLLTSLDFHWQIKMNGPNLTLRVSKCKNQIVFKHKLINWSKYSPHAFMNYTIFDVLLKKPNYWSEHVKMTLTRTKLCVLGEYYNKLNIRCMFNTSIKNSGITIIIGSNYQYIFG